jgi:hypothetical protein
MSEPKLFACCPVHIWETMAPELKAMPGYERIHCPRCRQPMLLSKRGRAMLDSGNAESPICSDCLLSIAYAERDEC